MLKCLIKRQWKAALGLVLLFGAFFLLYRQMFYSTYDLFYMEEVRSYIEENDPTDREAFFTQLNADEAEMQTINRTIMQFEGYEGEMPEETEGLHHLVNYDMLVWRSQMWNLPGRLGETLFDDDQIVRNVKERTGQQEYFEGVIDNHKELMRRGIRRGGEKIPLYEAAQTELDAIEMDFPVQDTRYAQQILIEMNRDWYILALVTLAVFTVFSQSNQLKVSRVISTSKLGAFRYTVSQLAASVLLTAAAFALYWVLMVLILCDFRPYDVPWTIPMQAITGYQTMMLDMSLGEYVLKSLGLKCLLCLNLSALVLLVSALSPNSIVSLLGSAAVCGGLIYSDGLLPQYHGLMVGRTEFLFDQLCWQNVGGRAVPYSLLYLFVLLAALVVLWGLVLLLAPPAIRKWGK